LWGIASLVDAFHVPKLLSQQLLPFGSSGDGLRVLTFEVEQFQFCSCLADGPRGPGGRSARSVFVVCSSCSCSSSLLVRCGFEFSWDEVSDGPRVPVRQSAGAWRTVRVVPADGPFFGVRYWRFCWILRMVRGSRPDGPRHGCGQSAIPCRTVRAAFADSPSHLAGQSARAWQLCSLVRFLPPFFRASACASRNRS
jgi:hypothetical protein